jgi:hypothetical protein
VVMVVDGCDIVHQSDKEADEIDSDTDLRLAKKKYQVYMSFLMNKVTSARLTAQD